MRDRGPLKPPRDSCASSSVSFFSLRYSSPSFRGIRDDRDDRHPFVRNRRTRFRLKRSLTRSLAIRIELLLWRYANPRRTQLLLIFGYR